DNDFIGNVIDVCPVGALTDRTFRFKNRVWFLKPMDAHRDCPTCSGKVTLWNRGDEVFRVTARKDEWGEVEDDANGKPAWICNTCRFDKKKTSDWTIEGPRMINRHSVISAGHYQGKVGLTKPHEIFSAVHGGRQPKILLDIHEVSEVNQPTIDLSRIEGPAHSDDFEQPNT
ncbi:MAG: Fe-S-binding domain-containing protein, partial [Chitinophagaceae bacterium]|nr:Fe-S-binding domain-containing protein [Chitinophagaceae bacterium]